MRAWLRAAATPWAITQESLEQILEIAARQNESPEAVAAKLGRELQNTHRAWERDGVAVIPVIGPLFRRANLFTMISGATSYEMVAQDLTAALDNPEIRSIVLDIDSPGGVVNGVAELSDLVFEARGQKPIIAYGGGMVASGAYWLASAADEIVIAETAEVGSIGVLAVVRDDRKRKEEAGIQETEIVSSQSPNKRVDPGEDDGRARLQRRIDALADVFIQHVARNRDMAPDEVVAAGDRGDILVGQAAVDNILVDRVASFEDLLEELTAAPGSRSTTPAMPNPVVSPGAASSAAQTDAGAAAGSNPSSSEENVMTEQTTPQPAAVTDETVRRDHPSVAQALEQAGASAERERIKAILTSEHSQGRDGLARHFALETDMPADAAVAALQAAAKEAASGFDASMRALGNPDVGPDGGAHATEDPAALGRQMAESARAAGIVQ